MNQNKLNNAGVVLVSLFNNPYQHSQTQYFCFEDILWADLGFRTECPFIAPSL